MLWKVIMGNWKWVGNGSNDFGSGHLSKWLQWDISNFKIFNYILLAQCWVDHRNYELEQILLHKIKLYNCLLFLYNIFIARILFKFVCYFYLYPISRVSLYRHYFRYCILWCYYDAIARLMNWFCMLQNYSLRKLYLINENY